MKRVPLPSAALHLILPHYEYERNKTHEKLVPLFAWIRYAALSPKSEPPFSFLSNTRLSAHEVKVLHENVIISNLCHV